MADVDLPPARSTSNQRGRGPQGEELMRFMMFIKHTEDYRSKLLLRDLRVNDTGAYRLTIDLNPP